MTSATALLWNALGSPAVDGCSVASGACYQCAGPVTSGLTVTDWMSSNYTDQNRVRNPFGTHVCAACVMVSRRLWPVPGRPAGACNGCDGTGNVTSVAKKGKTRNSAVGDPCPKCDGTGQATAGGNWRNYSHLFEENWYAPPLPDKTVVTNYCNASKGEKPTILSFLERDHMGVWFAAIADSGQKHVVPWAPLNGPGKGGLVIFDESFVDIPEDLGLVYQIRHLLTAGASKDEVTDGDYRSQTWMRCRRDIDSFEEENGGERGSEWFALALWLAQRDEAQVETRLAAEAVAKTEQKAAEKAAKLEARNADRPKKKARVITGRVHPVVTPLVRGEPQGKSVAGLLGSDPGHDASWSAHDIDDLRVGKQQPDRSSDQRTGQFRLPGFD
jgi:hypothetical protein